MVFLIGCAHDKSIQAAEEQKEKVIQKANFTVPLGERMWFSIRWLGFEVGTADVWVKEITKVKDRDAYHIVVTVKSNKLIDLIYPVRDEHHSYVDVEHLYSLRYEKNVREGGYRAEEVMDYDQVNHKARYESKRSGDVKEMLIPENVQDQLSCTFWFRIQPMKPNDTLYIPVNVDEKNWKLEVEVQAIEELDIEGFGKIQAIRAEPFARFQGLFVRKGRAWGWMSTDEKRIPLLMRTKIPILGTIYMVITEYQLGNYHVKG